MSKQFAATPDFTGLFEPSGIDARAFDLRVEGAIPQDLKGTFVRVQPDPAYAPMLGDDIFFNGDGAVSSFRFNAGRVDMVHRHVETERLLAQRAAGRSLFGIYRNRFTDDPDVQLTSYSTANTNVVSLAGKLLALKEDSLPYELDPASLDTIGVHSFDDQISARTFTAHPKYDPATGTSLALSYEAKGDGSDDLAFYEFDETGKMLRELWLKAPFAGMIHDIGFTPNYVIFPLMPLKVDLGRMRSGGRHFEWDPAQDMMFGLMRRDGDGSDLRWMTLPPAFPGHVQNAFEAGGKVVLDMPVANGNVFPFFPAADGYTTPMETIHAPLMRIVFDPMGPLDSAKMEALTTLSMEFGRVDDRFAGTPCRFGFSLGQDWSKPFAVEQLGPPHPFFFNVLLKVDVEQRAYEHWWPGPAASLQEPVFIPRSADAPEGDGFVLAVVNRLDTGKSDLVLLDTARFSEGPIAVITSPIRLRMGLHGNWIDAAGPPRPAHG